MSNHQHEKESQNIKKNHNIIKQREKKGFKLDIGLRATEADMGIIEIEGLVTRRIWQTANE